VPSARTDAGYRLYTNNDLFRLQQVLIQRELGLTLDGIRLWLDDPSYDRRQALLSQRRQLAERSAHTQAMLTAIDHALAVLDQQNGRDDMGVDFKKLFDGFDPAQYEAEVKERWGGTDAYRVSQQRVAAFNEADWAAIRDEQSAVYRDAWQALQEGVQPGDPKAMDVAERHRRGIERFYPCNHAMHAGLADMYEADQRFADSMDKYGAGLTTFLSAAIRANARRHQA